VENDNAGNRNRSLEYGAAEQCMRLPAILLYMHRKITEISGICEKKP